MPQDIYINPEQRSERPRGEQTIPDPKPHPATIDPDPSLPDGGVQNRGHHAQVTAAGEVVGSGAGTGGGGTPEDFDSDEASGGTAVNMAHPPRPNEGGDGSKHGSA